MRYVALVRLAFTLAALAATAVAVAAESRGAVTNLPLPRYVSMKAEEANARRGPSLAQRIDWVFRRRGMPLRITAEFDNWRRVEDWEGFGGWVHYSLLSGSRAVVFTEPLTDIRARPDGRAAVTARAEAGVTARLTECRPEWCEVAAAGERGWVRKSALWGVDADEILD